MSSFVDRFTTLYNETAVYGLLGGPHSGYMAAEEQIEGIQGKIVETIICTTDQPPSVTHVQYQDQPRIAAIVNRATLQNGEVTVERGYVALEVDRLADTPTRYDQAVNAATMHTMHPNAGQFLLLQMVEDTGGFFPITQS